MRIASREPSAPALPALPARTACPPLTVVVNAQASGIPPAARLDGLVRELRRQGNDVVGEVTASLADFADVWHRDDGRRLVLVGGDGSVHAAANLDGAPRDIALIPAGGANNIARSTGIPLDLRRAARLAAVGDVRPLDLIEARAPGRRMFVLESVSAGFLAEARTRYHGRNSADILAGLRAGAGALAQFRPLGLQVGDQELVVAQMFVANLPLYEFGLRVAPGADPTDAALDLVAIEAGSRIAILRMLAELRRGTHVARPGVQVWRARQVTLATGGSPIVADSTDLGSGPVEFAAAPQALRLVRP